MIYSLPTLQLINDDRLLIGLAQTGGGEFPINFSGSEELNSECSLGSSTHDEWLMDGINEGAQITITVTASNPSGSEIDLQLTVLDPSDTQISECDPCINANGADGTETCSFTAPSTGEYEIQVFALPSGGVGDAGTYNISVSGSQDGASPSSFTLDHDEDGPSCPSDSCPST